MFVTFTNQSGFIHSSNRAVLLPDSIDYVIYEKGGDLDDNAINDMRVLQEKKGTKILCDVSMSKIEQEWFAKLATNDQLTEDDFLKFIASRTQELLDLYSEYKYDGISFTFTGGFETFDEGVWRWSWGWFPEHIKYIEDGAVMYEKYVKRQNAFIDPILDWQTNNPNATFVFMGLPYTITLDRNDILERCKYIITTDSDITNPTEWNTDVNLTSMDRVALNSIKFAGTNIGIPTDRFIFSSEPLRSGDEGKLYGYFITFDVDGNNEIGVPTLANWIMNQTNPTPAGYNCVGMMIVNAEQDYFASKLPFAAIRSAIKTLNTDTE